MHLVDRGIERLDDRHVVGNNAVEQVIEEVVGALLQTLSLVALHQRAQLVEHRKWIVMVRDQVIRPEEQVKLADDEVVRVVVDIDDLKNEIEIVIPVIELGVVGLLQGVLDGQGMEMKAALEEILHLGELGESIGDVDPDGGIRAGERLVDAADGPVEVKLTL